jgi:hypothetical protein
MRTARATSPPPIQSILREIVMCSPPSPTNTAAPAQRLLRRVEDCLPGLHPVPNWSAGDTIPLERGRILRVIDTRPGQELDEDSVLVIRPLR